MHEETEICIVGGGPAGAVTALRLAQLGHSVQLLERASFPRPHVGESLAPGIWPLLDFLGLRQSIEGNGFLRQSPAIVHWRGPSEQGAAAGHGPMDGLLVDRGRFDQLLLRKAAENGVKVFQPARAQAPVRQPRGWIIPVELPGGNVTLTARILIDAAGRGGILPSRVKHGPSTLAIHARWLRVKAPRAATRVVSRPDHWWWAAPLPDDALSAMAFLDSKNPALRTESLDNLFSRLLTEAPLLSHVLIGENIGPAKACNATSFHCHSVADEDWIKVGEAACAIDPLSSQGVQFAMQSAIQASLVARTLLAFPEHTEAALEFYRNKLRRGVAFHQQAAADYYTTVNPAFRENPFWKERSSASHRLLPEAMAGPDAPKLNADSRLRLCSMARWANVPCAVGDRIELVPALCHPALADPAAYFAGLPLASVIPALIEGRVAHVRAELSPQIEDALTRMIHWLWRSRILHVIQSEGRPSELD